MTLYDSKLHHYNGLGSPFAPLLPRSPLGPLIPVSPFTPGGPGGPIGPAGHVCEHDVAVFNMFSLIIGAILRFSEKKLPKPIPCESNGTNLQVNRWTIENAEIHSLHPKLS